MKKIKIILITLIAIGGAIMIYHHFDKSPVDENTTKKQKNEYTLITGKNLLETKSIDEVTNIINNKTGVVFLCNPKSDWCQYYAYLLNDAAIERGIDKIYYANIADERNMNSNKYQKLVTALEDYLYTDDTNNKRIYMPNMTVVKDGKILANNNETSIMLNNISAKDYWNESNQFNFKEKLSNYINLLNKIEVPEESEEEE
jgi:hypothetical protein